VEHLDASQRPGRACASTLVALHQRRALRAHPAIAVAVVAALVVVAAQTIEVIPEFLYDAPEQTADLFRRMWPFDWAFWRRAVARGARRDLPHRDAGHAASSLLPSACLLALLAARNVTRSPPRSNLGRAVHPRVSRAR
jgi:ABC-type phosphate/phosphonate transport system permease subunit